MKHTRFPHHDSGQTKAMLEESIARAHRAVYHAMQQAEALGQEGTRSDLESMLMTLTALGQDQLRRRPGTRRVG
jgi:hypothetical protein